MGNSLRLTKKSAIILVLAGIFFFPVLAGAETVKVIGQIESVYLQRASLRVLEIPGEASDTSPLAIGQKISFALPAVQNKKKRDESVAYGKVVQVELEGAATTEYSNPDIGEASAASPTAQVYIWTANKISRVKNQKKYLEGTAEKKGKGKGKGKKHKKGKKGEEEDEDKIWTQEETVRGTVLVKDKRLYVKEERCRPKDRGLDVLNDEWYEKLKPFEGQTVVVHGTTRRISISSGTMDVGTLIKIYPK